MQQLLARVLRKADRGETSGLIISFGTRELLDCCSSLAAAEQRLGSAHAQTLISLIADAEAFEVAHGLIEFFGSQANIDEHDSLFLAIGSDYRAQFVPAGVRFARNAEGKIDWASVQRLKLVDISGCSR
jgi:hypothetical protein